jgi:DNA-binding NarL/FixJ family response regulator
MISSRRQKHKNNRGVPSNNNGDKIVHIMIVDDNYEFTRSLNNFLSHSKHLLVVNIVRTGEEAVDLVDKVKPDLVLMDIFMKTMNGLEATRLMKMKTICPKIIIVSVFESKEFQSSADLVNVDGFVTKSQIGTKLIPMINKLFPNLNIYSTESFH